MTGVEVMPTDGEMLPQGSSPLETAGARWRVHTTCPVVAESAYTRSVSVAT